MGTKIELEVNGLVHRVSASLDAPLLDVLHNELHADRGSDPQGDERPALPLRHVLAHPDHDQTGSR
jgi:hypothetical protein